MLAVQHQQLPNAQLLIISSVTNAPAKRLATELQQADSASPLAVVVDLSLVDGLPEEAIDLLLAFSVRLHARQRRLIFCHVPQPDRHRFRCPVSGGPLLLVASVLDAMHEISLPTD